MKNSKDMQPGHRVPDAEVSSRTGTSPVPTTARLAEAVATIQIALDILCEDISRLLMANDERVDFDQSNGDGSTLLSGLKEGGLSEARKIVALRAYDTKARMRRVFRDLRVADFKEDFDCQPFLENAHLSFDKRVGANLAIFWVDTETEQAIHSLQIEDVQVDQDELLKKRVTRELDDLLRRLFSNAESVIVRPLVSTPSRSGMGVLSIQPFYPTGGGQAVVLKYGHFPQVKKEVQHFQKFV